MLDGQGGNDVLDGRGGNDTLTGGGGSDQFFYSAAPTRSRILIGPAVHSIMPRATDRSGRVRDHQPGTLASIDHEPRIGTDTLINFGGGNTMTLNNVTLANLTPSDFIFSAPISGDLGISVNKGGMVVLTTADFHAVDPNSTAAS